MNQRSTDEALAYFNNTPWTATWTQDPAYEAPQWANPTTGGPGTSNGFYMNTLNSSESLPHILVLVKKDLPAPPSEDISPQVVRRSPSVQETPPDMALLMKLGNGGLDSHSGLMHGGMVGALLDHSAGYTVAARSKGVAKGESLQLYTVHMSTSFFRPVRTEGRDVVVKSWLVSKTSSKWVTRAQIVDEHGVVLAQGDALWIVVKPKM